MAAGAAEPVCGFLRFDRGWMFFSSQGPLEQSNELGIMFRHAYSLTAVEKVNKPQELKQMPEK